MGIQTFIRRNYDMFAGPDVTREVSRRPPEAEYSV